MRRLRYAIPAAVILAAILVLALVAGPSILGTPAGF